MTTLAGQVVASGSVNGTGSAARFNYPSGAAVDGNGNVYISDFGNQSYARLVPRAWSPLWRGWLGSPGPTTAPALPPGSTVQPAWRLIAVATCMSPIYQNHGIRKITPAGVVTTLAGRLGTSGTNNGTGTAARFNNPHRSGRGHQRQCLCRRYGESRDSQDHSRGCGDDSGRPGGHFRHQRRGGGRRSFLPTRKMSQWMAATTSMWPMRVIVASAKWRPMAR